MENAKSMQRRGLLVSNWKLPRELSPSCAKDYRKLQLVANGSFFRCADTFGSGSNRMNGDDLRIEQR
jgi:hypothetical protein